MAAVTPPNTTAQLSHAVTMRVNGEPIGAINEWGPKQGRGIAELFEFGAQTAFNANSNVSGVPFEKVPNNVTGQTMDVRRYDLYTRQMENAFGRIGTGADSRDLTMLANQLSSFEVFETWVPPAFGQPAGGGTSSTSPYTVKYQGCWFSNIGRQLSATNDRTINVNATIEYTRKDRA